MSGARCFNRRLRQQQRRRHANPGHLSHRAEAPLPDIEQMLATTPTETLQQAAAENYDDILYNQQL